MQHKGEDIRGLMYSSTVDSSNDYIRETMNESIMLLIIIHYYIKIAMKMNIGNFDSVSYSWTVALRPPTSWKTIVCLSSI